MTNVILIWLSTGAKMQKIALQTIMVLHYISLELVLIQGQHSERLHCNIATSGDIKYITGGQVMILETNAMMVQHAMALVMSLARMDNKFQSGIGVIMFKYILTE